MMPGPFGAPASAKGGCSVFAVIVAAGRGERLGRPKALVTLGERTFLEHCLDAFLAAGPWKAIAVAARPEDLGAIVNLQLPPIVKLSVGGERRQDSVLAGITALGAADGRILVHDVARPLVTPTLIRRVREAQGVVVVPAIPVDDTLRRREGERKGTFSREGMVRVQTPQAFDVALLRQRLEAARETVTDEASLFEDEGMTFVEGDPSNFKITREADLAMARALSGDDGIRMGHGYDVHPTVLGGPMRLGGVDIPADISLVGHSDGDVLLHAVADALLGAAGEPDIGFFFPPGAKETRRMDSAAIVHAAVDRLGLLGLRPVQVDVTVAALSPKIGPHRGAIRERLADLLSLDIDRVNVKATTEEGLGDVGRGLGVRAWAVALVSSGPALGSARPGRTTA